MGPLPLLAGGFGPAEKAFPLSECGGQFWFGFPVSGYDEHWQTQLVMDLSGWVIYFQFEYSKLECLGEGMNGDKVCLSGFSPCTHIYFSCLFCFLVFEDSDNLTVGNSIS